MTALFSSGEIFSPAPSVELIVRAARIHLDSGDTQLSVCVEEQRWEWMWGV